jgi:hypothetical protein
MPVDWIVIVQTRRSRQQASTSRSGHRKVLRACHQAANRNRNCPGIRKCEVLEPSGNGPCPGIDGSPTYRQIPRRPRRHSRHAQRNRIGANLQRSIANTRLSRHRRHLRRAITHNNSAFRHRISAQLRPSPHSAVPNSPTGPSHALKERTVELPSLRAIPRRTCITPANSENQRLTRRNESGGHHAF